MKNHFLTDKELDKESKEDIFPRYIGRKWWDAPLPLFAVSKAHKLPHCTLLYLAQGLSHGIPSIHYLDVNCIAFKCDRQGNH